MTTLDQKVLIVCAHCFSSAALNDVVGVRTFIFSVPYTKQMQKYWNVKYLYLHTNICVHTFG